MLECLREPKLRKSAGPQKGTELGNVVHSLLCTTLLLSLTQISGLLILQEFFLLLFIRNQPTPGWEYLSYNCRFAGKRASDWAALGKHPLLIQLIMTEGVGPM